MALLESMDSYGVKVSFDPRNVLFMKEITNPQKNFTLVVQLIHGQTLYLVDSYTQLVEIWEQEVYGNTGQAVS